MSQPWAQRVTTLASISARAAVGALTLRWHIGLGVALAAAIALVVAALGHWVGAGRKRGSASAF